MNPEDITPEPGTLRQFNGLVAVTTACLTRVPLAFNGCGIRKERDMGQDQIDHNLACVEGHFHSEAENNIEAALELYTDDIIFEAGAINGLNRSFSGKQAVAKFYRELWATMSAVKFQPLQRFATENRVVDDSLASFEVVRDGCWPHFSSGQKIEMR